MRNYKSKIQILNLQYQNQLFLLSQLKRMIQANEKNKLKRVNFCFIRQDRICISYKSEIFELSREPSRIQDLKFLKNTLIQSNLNQQEWAQVIQFDCIYGIIQLQNTVALILVMKGQEVAIINQKAIYQVKETKIVYVSNIKVDPFSCALQLSFKLFKIYYSHDFDLSTRLQAQHQNNKYAQNRYISNFNQTSKHQQYPKQLITICITGLIKSFTLAINHSLIKITLISRANANRIGRRWYRRGIDNQANTANQNESQLIWEVIAKQTHRIYSYVQVRGSIPLFWQQTAGINQVEISEDKQKNKVQIKKYLERMVQEYGDVTFLNLIQKRGRQKKIGMLYGQYFEQAEIKKTNLIWFDFGTQYKVKKQVAFQQLMQQLKKRIDGQIFEALILQDGRLIVENKQTKVIRTNCMDCLDRTNYIQHLIAKYVSLQLQAKEGGRYRINSFPYTFRSNRLQDKFKQLWTQNGMAISQQYSGTPPMKSDFLSCNRRTLKGRLTDFIVGSKRTYLGYYFDFYYQNCIDLHFGRINFQRDSEQFNPNLQKRILQLLAFCGVISVLFKVIAFPLMLKDNILQKCKDSIHQSLYFGGSSLLGLMLGGIITKFGYKYILQLPISRKYQQL